VPVSPGDAKTVCKLCQFPISRHRYEHLALFPSANSSAKFNTINTDMDASEPGMDLSLASAHSSKYQEQ